MFSSKSDYISFLVVMTVFAVIAIASLIAAAIFSPVAAIPCILGALAISVGFVIAWNNAVVQ